MQEHGQRATTPHFVLLVARREEPESCARLGIVVTKKVGNAVQRNRIKRVCRECFRLWGHAPPLVPAGIDLVVIAREGAHELGLAEVRAEWEKAQAVLGRRCATALSGPLAGRSLTATKESLAQRKPRPHVRPRNAG